MKNILLFSIFIFIFSACKKWEAPALPSTGNADMSRVIFIGGNYMCGMKDGVWNAANQQTSIAAIIAQQIALADADSFCQPLLSAGDGVGFLNHSQAGGKFQQLLILKNSQLTCDTAPSLFPFATTSLSTFPSIINLQKRGLFNNLSFPNATVTNYSETAPAFNSQFLNLFYPLFAAEPGVQTPLHDATQYHATFAFISLGMDDIYNYAFQGGVAAALPIISAADFENRLDNILSQLKQNGIAGGAIATIPDLNVLPFYNTIPSQGIVLDSAQAVQLNGLYGNSPVLKFVMGKNGFIAESNTGTLIPGNTKKLKVLEASEKILLNIPIDSLKCLAMGVAFPIPDYYVLDKAELVLINQTILSFNQIIQRKALQYDLALVDWNTLMNDLKTGKRINGVDFNNKFISGGFFSLDGYNPSTQGNAILANEFIAAINLKYNSNIPTADVLSFKGIVFP